MRKTCGLGETLRVWHCRWPQLDCISSETAERLLSI